MDILDYCRIIDDNHYRILGLFHNRSADMEVFILIKSTRKQPKLFSGYRFQNC